MAQLNLKKVATTNAFSTTLGAAITSTDTTIPLNSTTGLQAPGILVIDRQDGSGNDTPSKREYIYFTSVVGNSVVLPSVADGRGQGGSTAQAHSAGALVEEVLTVDHWGGLISSYSTEHTDEGRHVLSGPTIIDPDLSFSSVASIAIPAGKLGRSGELLVVGGGALSTNVKARARLSVSQTVSTGVHTKLQFDTIEYDPGGNFDTTNYQYTAPITGYYLVKVSAWPQLAADQNYADVGIGINWLSGGAPTYWRRVARSGMYNIVFECVEILYLTKGDTVCGTIFLSGGTSVAASDGTTSIAIHLLSVD